MKENITIELTKQSMQDLRNLGGEAVIDLQHLPFKSFEFQLPIEGYSKEEVFESLENSYLFKGMGKAEKKEHIKSVLAMMDKDDIFLKASINDKEVRVEDAGWYIKATANDWIVDTREDPKVCWKDLDLKGKSEKAQELVSSDEGFVESCVMNLRLALGIIAFLQSDKKDDVRVETKTIVEEKKKKNKSKSKRNNKTYIYNKRYVFKDDDTKDLITHHRPYERKTEQWLSRGHWRHYKSGKKVWIAETVKKAKNTVSSPLKKEYKITKVD